MIDVFLVGLLGLLLRQQLAFLQGLFANPLPDLRVVSNVLSHNVHRALERLLCRLDAFFGIDILRRFLLKLPRLWQCQQILGERLQPFFLGHRRTGAALLLVGAVQILYLLQLHRSFDRCLQLIRQFSLLLDQPQDLFLAYRQIAQIAKPLFNRPNLRFIQLARHLFAVTSDKRHRIALVQQSDGALCLMRFDTRILGNCLNQQR